MGARAGDYTPLSLLVLLLSGVFFSGASDSQQRRPGAWLGKLWIKAVVPGTFESMESING